MALTLLALVFAGCGSDDSESNGSGMAEADARAAVADFLTAMGDADGDVACAKLTSSAQKQVEGLLARVTGRPAGECSAVLEALLATAKTGAFATLIGAAEQIRSGELKGGGEVTVAIAEDNGTVTITADDKLLPIPVERTNGAWLISDGRGLLFGTGR